MNKQETIIERYAAQYPSAPIDSEAQDAADNALHCVVECGHGQTFETVWDFINTAEGEELFLKYFEDSLQSSLEGNY